MLLEIRGLNTYYGESHILRDVDLTVKKGEMVCLIGRNGVGKTTLLKTVIGLLKPRGGELVLNGEGLERQPPHRRARAGRVLPRARLRRLVRHLGQGRRQHKHRARGDGRRGRTGRRCLVSAGLVRYRPREDVGLRNIMTLKS